MRNAERGEAERLDGRGLRIAVVQARFNVEVTDRIARACTDELVRLGVGEDDITHVRVPGALEIGVALNAIADGDEHDALIAVGCVLRGETYHFELVANAILTCDTPAQADARAEEKGRDAARAAVEMANLLDELS